VVYDVLDGYLEVYARGIGGPLFEKFWTGSSWSSWIDLGGSISAP
jgi:hypothetical protein